MLQLTRTLLARRDAVAALSRVSLKTTVATTRLGWLWWILDPLVMMAIYYFMVKVVFGHGGPDYHLFALIGITAWQFFARTVQLTSTALLRNRRLITHTTVPLEVFVVEPVVIQAFFALIGLGIIIVWHGQMPGAAMLWLFPVMGVVALFGLAAGVLLSIWVVFLPDVSKFVEYGLRAGFFITPILYSASRITGSERIPEALKAILSLNPMMWAIPRLREVILAGESVSLPGFFAWLGAGIVLLQLAVMVLRRNRQNLMKHL